MLDLNLKKVREEKGDFSSLMQHQKISMTGIEETAVNLVLSLEHY